MMVKIGIEKLRELGVNAIAEKTKITPTKVKYILDKSFDKLDKVSTVGFIRLIEKDFKADLSEWMEEYSQFLESQNSVIEEKPVFVWSKNKKNPTKKVLIFLLFIVLLYVAYYIYKNNTQETRFSFSLLNDTLNELFTAHNKSEPQNSITIDPNITSSLEASSSSLSIEYGNTTEANMSDMSMHISFPKESNMTETNKTSSSSVNQTQNSTKVPIHKISITPSQKVWLGIIYLDTGNKVNKFIDTEHIFDVKRKQLIVLGKGDVMLNINDTKEHIASLNPIRFHYDGREIKSIGYDEFLALNGGKIW